MKHDFEGALRVFNTVTTKDVFGNKYETAGGIPVETIQLALRIADRLQKGEIKHMTTFQQLIKECE